MASQFHIYFSCRGQLDALRTSWERSPFPGRLGPDEVAVGGLRPATATSREILDEAFGLDVDTALWFKLDKFRLESAVEFLAEVFVGWVLPLEGDFVLLKDGELPIAYRYAGRLVRQRTGLPPIWDQVWSRTFLSLPHELSDIPIL